VTFGDTRTPTVGPVPEPRPVYVTRPPKPVSAMTDEERRRYAEQVWRTFTEANPRLAEDEDRE
jgi:hypothetical protein